jgi:hypothetical protein
MTIERLSFSITYQTITPESAEYGEFDEDGFVFEDIEPDDIRDLISLIDNYRCFDWSCSDNSGWLSSDSEVSDDATMEEIIYSLHANNSRSARYLAIALNGAQ